MINIIICSLALMYTSLPEGKECLEKLILTIEEDEKYIEEKVLNGNTVSYNAEQTSIQIDGSRQTELVLMKQSSDKLYMESEDMTVIMDKTYKITLFKSARKIMITTVLPGDSVGYFNSMLNLLKNYQNSIECSSVTYDKNGKVGSVELIDLRNDVPFTKVRFERKGAGLYSIYSECGASMSPVKSLIANTKEFIISSGPAFKGQALEQIFDKQGNIIHKYSDYEVIGE